MRGRESGKRWLPIIGVTMAVTLLAGQGHAALTTFTYTGGGANPNVWSDPANWSKSGAATSTYPGELAEETLTVIPNGFSPSFTTGAIRLYRLQTGDGAVSLNGDLSAHDGSPYAPNWTIGTGGLSVTGNVWTSRGAMTANGNVAITGNLKYWGHTLTQTAGTLTLGGNMTLSEQVSTFVRAWVFAAPYNGTFSHGSIFSGKTITWSGTPDFAGGRPNWSLVQGGDNGGTWDVGVYTLMGNNLTIGNWSGGGTRHGRMLVNGGSLDVNTLTVNHNGSGFTKWNYLLAQNATITLRGSGTAWSIQTEGNGDFSLTNNTSVVFAPAAGSLSVDTGSKDRNSVARDPADWKNNFAFDKIAIAAGATITLTGTANIEGGGNTALYATSLEGLGAGATVNLNGRNVYLLKNASNITFTGAGAVYQQSHGTTVLVR